MRSRKRQIRLVGSLALIGLLSTLRGATSEPEDELKSAIVLSFLRYSEWPGGAPAAGPLTVGVLGRPSFTQVLRGLLDGKTVNNRPIRVIEIKTMSEPHCCQVIYVAIEKGADIKKALADARPTRALTIGESERFLEYGGAVNLLQVDGHMGFEVNLEALGLTGVEISSKLLRYGQVKGKRS